MLPWDQKSGIMSEYDSSWLASLTQGDTSESRLWVLLLWCVISVKIWTPCEVCHLPCEVGQLPCEVGQLLSEVGQLPSEDINNPHAKQNGVYSFHVCCGEWASVLSWMVTTSGSYWNCSHTPCEPVKVQTITVEPNPLFIGIYIFRLQPLPYNR